MQLQREYERRIYIEKYLPHIGIALQEILELTDEERDLAVKQNSMTCYTRAERPEYQT